ncbi:MAG: hypothetical protein J5546_02835 [Lachnospiraceae bacterium]|nr:hypothetical protein [Lachnospiraceae bacterium]
MKKRKLQAEAYFTVEASLVLPIVIGAVVFTICFLLFCYNRCVMEQDVGVLTVMTAPYGAKSLGMIIPRVRTWKEEMITDKYYAWDAGDFLLSQSGDKRVIMRSGKLMIGDRLWTASAEREVPRVQPTFFVRICRSLEGKG